MSALHFAFLLYPKACVYLKLAWHKTGRLTCAPPVGLPVIFPTRNMLKMPCSFRGDLQNYTEWLEFHLCKNEHLWLLTYTHLDYWIISVKPRALPFFSVSIPGAYRSVLCTPWFSVNLGQKTINAYVNTQRLDRYMRCCFYLYQVTKCAPCLESVSSSLSVFRSFGHSALPCFPTPQRGSETKWPNFDLEFCCWECLC